MVPLNSHAFCMSLKHLDFVLHSHATGVFLMQNVKRWEGPLSPINVSVIITSFAPTYDTVYSEQLEPLVVLKNTILLQNAGALLSGLQRMHLHP